MQKFAQLPPGISMKLDLNENSSQKTSGMEQKSKVRISRTRDLPNPTEYVQLLEGELREWAFNEERAPIFRGKWRAEVFKVAVEAPLDLEIGTGNGYFFAHHANKSAARSFVGIELK